MGKPLVRYLLMGIKKLRFKAGDVRKFFSEFYTYSIIGVNGVNTRGDYYEYTVEDFEEDFTTDKEVIAVVDGFSKKGEELFIVSFKRNAPSSYNFEKDIDSNTPLCMPWLWFISLEEPYWLSCADNPTDCGKNWAEYCKVYSYFEVREE